MKVNKNRPATRIRRIENLKAGDTFKFYNVHMDQAAIYMKTDQVLNADSYSVVVLGSGALIHLPYNKEVEVVDAEVEVK